jgi:transposase
MTKQELIRENTQIKKKISSLKEQLAKKEIKYRSLQEQFSQIIKLINGNKSERLIPSDIPDIQGNLFEEQTQQSNQEDTEEQEIKSYKRKKTKHKGRNKLPEHLPVKEVIIEPEEDTEGLVKIGEEITETLEYTPASLIKRRTIRPKYAKKDNNGILIGQLPSRPIEKSIAEASLLAYILVCKYVDHLPLYRLAQKFNREFDWHPAQSTLCDWVDSCCKLLNPLYNRLKQKIISSDYIQADESPIKVLDKDKIRKTHQGYQWVYYNPMDNLVLFNYRKGRGQNGPKEILSDYCGYLQCDGYRVYDNIGQQEGIKLVGCLAHARRKFFDAQDNDQQKARYALELIAKIYHLDKQINLKYEKDYTQIQKERKEKIEPILIQIKTWIEQENLRVLPKSAIAKAMRYFITQYPKLEAVMLDGRLKLDNNLIENKIRPLALGRKNYLFAGSHNAAQNTAMLYSFFGSFKANDVDPLKWLQDVLEKIPDYNIQKLDELLPDKWNNDRV